jgi:hypothetical protein
MLDVQHKQKATEKKRIYRALLKQRLEMCTRAPPTQEIRKQALRLCVTSIAQFLLDQLSVVGCIEQQKTMLNNVLDHKLLLTMRPNHLLSLKDVKTTINIVSNVKVGLQFVKEAKNKN